MLLLLSFSLLALISLSLLIHRSIIHPAFVQPAVWFVAVTLLLVFQDQFVPVSSRVVLLILFGSFAFVFGATVTTTGVRQRAGRQRLKGPAVLPRTVVLALFGLCLALSIAFLLQILRIATGGPSADLFFNIRWTLAVGDSGALGAVAYVTPLLNVAALFAVFSLCTSGYRGQSKLVLMAIVLLAFVVAASNLSRTAVLQLVIPSLSIVLLTRAWSTRVTLMFGLVLGLSAFGLIGVLLSKGGSRQLSVVDNLQTVSQNLLVYVVGSIPALSVLEHEARDGVGALNSTVARPIRIVQRLLGAPVKPSEVVQPYVRIPGPFNVYSVYQPYVAEFGLVGAVAVQLLLGTLHGLCYRLSYSEVLRPAPVIIFALLMFPLVNQIFTDGYFTLLSTWIQQVSYVFLLVVALPLLLRDVRRNAKERQGLTLK